MVVLFSIRYTHKKITLAIIKYNSLVVFDEPSKPYFSLKAARVSHCQGFFFFTIPLSHPLLFPPCDVSDCLRNGAKVSSHSSGAKRWSQTGSWWDFV